MTMTIRSRLLTLLLPPLVALFIFIPFLLYFNWSQEILLFGSCGILLFVIGTVFVIADRMSKPVSQLNRAALEIAAGNYEANIQINGPKEIQELAHTFNTMSECLVEHMSRLRESSLIRERMYGEYECALLLQHYMLQKVIEEYNNPSIQIRLISLPASPLQKGLLLVTHDLPNSGVSFTLLESEEEGFSSLFHLNQCARLSYEEMQKNRCLVCQIVDQYRVLRYDAHVLFFPLIWSTSKQQFKKSNTNSQEIALDDLDMVFLYNSSLMDQFGSEEAIEEWMGKVLRHFSKDGLDIVQTMLTNELAFLAGKPHAKHGVKIICLYLERAAK